MKKKHVIYLIAINGVPYVGQTADLRVRQKAHINALKRGDHHNTHMQRAFDKHGISALQFRIIEGNIPASLVDWRERFWIAHFDSRHNGFNQDDGGCIMIGANAKSCHWNGIQYQSLTHAARDNGVTRKAISYRLARGYTCDNDLQTNSSNSFGDKRARFPSRVCVWNEIEYASVQECAAANGVEVYTMSYRLGCGYSCDNDVPGSGMSRPCVWNGVKYDRIADAARANSIPVHSMHRYIKNGYTCSEDVRPQSGSNRLSCLWNGVLYDSITAAARANHVSTATMKKYRDRGYVCDNDIEDWRSKR